MVFATGKKKKSYGTNFSTKESRTATEKNQLNRPAEKSAKRKNVLTWEKNRAWA